MSPQWDLAEDQESVRLARRLVAGELAQDIDPRAAADAVLATSELVTNALLHTTRSFQLVLRVDPKTIRIEVADQSPEVPSPRSSNPDGERGRGLMIVEHLARRWGYWRAPGDRKAVWCEIPRGDTPAGSEPIEPDPR